MQSKARSATQLLSQLRDLAYADLRNWQLNLGWGRLNAFAHVSWTDEILRLKLNVIVKRWPEPALVGLLAHELSHPAAGPDGVHERTTDIDVVRRGVGAYLAFERAFVRRYEDQLVGRGDYYLGYRRLRSLLLPDETEDLDMLLRHFRLIPRRVRLVARLHHDSIGTLETNTVRC
ncbi:MAG: hypothetical protein HXY34_10100 [Candidatus Thorarchaeota archaeon]|nr:hypothetical protein [Candidatus Thorarchaeota archaeon]